MKRVVLLGLLGIAIFVSSCKKEEGPTEPEGDFILGENTKLPEDNPDLDDMLIEGDTLYFIYKPGASKPEFDYGDIVVGQISEGYLKKVKSTTVSGDTIILITEQASLIDAVEKGTIDTTFSLSPSSKMMMGPIEIDSVFMGDNGKLYHLYIRSENYKVTPIRKGELFEISIPNVSIEVKDINNDLAFSLTIDTLVVEKSIDVDFNVQIYDGNINFRMVASATDVVNFKGVNMNLQKSILSEDIQIKLLTVPLGTVVLWIGIVPIPIIFEFGVYAGVGVDLTINVSTEIANDVSLNSSTDIGAEYSDGSWQTIYNRTLSGVAEFTFNPSATLEASLTGFFKGSLDTKIYGVLGPNLYLKPYQYNEVSYPPFEYELGVGVRAGLGFKVEILSWNLVEFNYTFADYKISLLQSENNPPYMPSNPSPSDGATGQSVNTNLNWTSGDPDGDDVTYDVYLEANDSSPDQLVSDDQTGITYDPGTLNYSTHYYWKIISKDEHGETTVGPVWNFTTSTAANNPPYTPSNPSPSDGATGQSVNTNLNWTGGDPNGDAVTYDVYLEANDSSPDQLVSDDQTGTTYDPGTLNYNTHYYWKIISKDEHGATKEGSVWDFTTGTAENNPPYAPSNPFPPDGAIDQSINTNLNWTGGDPNGDDVTYDVYFGTSTSPPLVSDDQADTTYDPGTMDYNTHYYWRVIAKDEYDASTEGPLWDFSTSDSTTQGEMVYVPAGWFTMGSDPGEGDSNEEPEHSVYLDAYYIDKYEVTKRQYCDFMNDWGSNDDGEGHSLLDLGSPYCQIYESGGVYYVESEKDSFPVIEVSWYGAKVYCEWRGGRLPTEAEWEKAARGSEDERTYPWGEGIDGSRANYWNSGDPYETGDYPPTTPVGYYNGETHDGFQTTDSPSPYGCYDMAGNVWEWCNDCYSSGYYSVSPDTNPQGPSSGSYRMRRGGSWKRSPYDLRCANRHFGSPEFTWSYLGFRCAGTP